MTKEQAVKLAESKFWESMTLRERATFQLFAPMLCMPFSVFHEAIEKTFGRPVYTHEFTSSNWESLKSELVGERTAPTMQEIIQLIPEDKRILISVNQ